MRTRRSSEEVRNLILSSARRLFSIHGYGGTSTRDVARESGTTAAAIYRHFGSKQGLFDGAVEEPLRGAIAGFLQDWDFLGPDQANNAAAVRLYMKSLVELLRSNRELIGLPFHSPTSAYRLTIRPSPPWPISCASLRPVPMNTSLRNTHSRLSRF